MVTNEILNLVGIMVTIIAPVFLFRYFHVLDVKRTEKEKKIADDLKEDNERKALELKSQTASIAEDIKVDLEGSQEMIKKDLEGSKGEIKKELERSQVVIRQELEIANTAIKKQIEVNNIDINNKINIITQKIDAVNTRQAETHKNQLSLIADLQHRGDLTNGNIENIRNDIMDLQDILEELFKRIPPRKNKANDNTSDNVSSNANGMIDILHKRKRQNKRKAIQDDAHAQSWSKLNAGTNHSNKDETY